MMLMTMMVMMMTMTLVVQSPDFRTSVLLACGKDEESSFGSEQGCVSRHVSVDGHV